MTTSSSEPQSSTPIRLAIVDDHPYLREGIRVVTQAESRIEIVGEAASAEAALELLAATPVDILLVDIHLPGKNGIQLTLEVRAQYPLVKVIILSAEDKPQYLLGAQRAGAWAYAVKTGGNLIATILAVAAGFNLMPAATALGPAPREVLTPQQFEVFKCVGQGYADKDTAEKLGISPETVKKHRDNGRGRLRKLQPPLDVDPVSIASWLRDWGELE
ncbi:MAG TPA: response regulator transcription factor [Polyangiaceae bacterium]|nr:response regulator transcription factor [Polyangiaceae bacterium]